MDPSQLQLLAQWVMLWKKEKKVSKSGYNNEILLLVNQQSPNKEGK